VGRVFEAHHERPLVGLEDSAHPYKTVYPERGGLLVGQVSNLTEQTRSGWKPDLPAAHQFAVDGPV